jgi:hypothetical protein
MVRTFEYSGHGKVFEFAGKSHSDAQTSKFRENVFVAAGTTTVAHSEIRPINEYDALMRCAPGDEPDATLDSLLPLRDILGDALDLLDERELWIFNSLTTQRLSLRQVGEQLSLSKTHVARLRDEIMAKLRTALETNPTIREYLCR